MHDPIDAIVFDCDGTLVDSEPAGFAAIQDMASAWQLQLDRPEDLQALKGRSMAQVLALLGGLSQAQQSRALPADAEPQIRRAMQRRFDQMVRPMPGASELLPWLNARGIPWCVASNGPRAKMLQTLAVAGLLALCQDRLVSAYEVGSFKPDPQLLLHAASTLGVAAPRCAMVEDSAPGVHAALAAGMRTFVMASPDPLPDDLLPQVTLIDDLRMLMDLPFGR